MNRFRLAILLVLVFGGALLRLAGIRVPMLGIEGGANFAPIGAIAIFCGLTFRNRWMAFLVPLLATFTSDLVLGLMNGDLGRYVFNRGMLFVYFGWVLYVVCGRGVRFISDKGGDGVSAALTRVFSFPVGAFLGSILFFVVSNFGFWFVGSFYPKTIAGLQECYVAAIPFFRATAQSDVLYLAGLVAADAVARVLTANEAPESTVRFAD